MHQKNTVDKSNYEKKHFPTGNRFLFSRWFCSIILRSCSPSSILSVVKKNNSENLFGLSYHNPQSKWVISHL